MSELDRSREEHRAPICPGCGVTALPIEADDPDAGFLCENPGCEMYTEVV
ncbi:MAG: hypothetical protein ACR2HR_07520 [Euzebya sp.]